MTEDLDDFQTEPVHGLPEALPEGEFILWQGRPNAWSLARDSLNFWWVAGYFALLFVWRLVAGTADAGLGESAAAASLWLVMGVAVCALLIGISTFQAKATVYTITNRRVAMRIGAALTLTMNLPFRRIINATLSNRGDGTGTIALELDPNGGRRVSFLMIWPHVRPWHFANPQPALRCIPDPQRVAEILSEAAETAISEPVIELAPALLPVAGE